MTKSSQTIPEAWLARLSPACRSNKTTGMLVVTQQSLLVFDVTALNLFLKVTEARESVHLLQISPLKWQFFSEHFPQICHMVLNSIAHHRIMLDEEYQDSRRQ